MAESAESTPAPTAAQPVPGTTAATAATNIGTASSAPPEEQHQQLTLYDNDNDNDNNNDNDDNAFIENVVATPYNAETAVRLEAFVHSRPFKAFALLLTMLPLVIFVLSIAQFALLSRRIDRDGTAADWTWAETLSPAWAIGALMLALQLASLFIAVITVRITRVFTTDFINENLDSNNNFMGTIDVASLNKVYHASPIHYIFSQLANIASVVMGMVLLGFVIGRLDGLNNMPVKHIMVPVFVIEGLQLVVVLWKLKFSYKLTRLSTIAALTNNRLAVQTEDGDDTGENGHSTAAVRDRAKIKKQVKRTMMSVLVQSLGNILFQHGARILLWVFVVLKLDGGTVVDTWTWHGVASPLYVIFIMPVPIFLYTLIANHHQLRAEVEDDDSDIGGFSGMLAIIFSVAFFTLCATLAVGCVQVGLIAMKLNHPESIRMAVAFIPTFVFLGAQCIVLLSAFLITSMALLFVIFGPSD